VSKAQVTRRRLYESPLFREQVADRLCLNVGQVANSVDTLLDAKVLPCNLSTNARSLAADGASILMGIGSQQPEPDSIARTMAKFGMMSMQCEVGGRERPLGVADIFPRTQSISFGTDLAELFLNLWTAAHGSSASGFAGVSVKMFWSDVRGTVLFGVVEQQNGRCQRVYASAPVIPAGTAGQWDFLKLQTVGGTIFSPLSILRFGALLDASVADTAADFGNSTPSKRRIH
jgi:hypothetical protein